MINTNKKVIRAKDKVSSEQDKYFIIDLLTDTVTVVFAGDIQRVVDIALQTSRLFDIYNVSQRKLHQYI